MNQVLGARIAEVREAHGKTQVDVAKALGVVQSSISKIELGRMVPPMRRLPALFEAIEATAAERLYILSAIS